MTVASLVTDILTAQLLVACIIARFVMTVIGMLWGVNSV